MSDNPTQSDTPSCGLLILATLLLLPIGWVIWQGIELLASLVS